MAWKQVWITSAKDDEEAWKALRLAKSLRKTLTGKKLLVIPGIEVSYGMVESLNNEFDVMLPLQVGSLMTGAKNDFEGAVKIALHGTQFYKDGIFLSCSVVVLRNVDFLFDKIFSDLSACNKDDLMGNCEILDLHCPIFALKPSSTSLRFLRDPYVANKSGMTDSHIYRLQQRALGIFEKYGASLTSSNDIDDKMMIDNLALVNLPEDFNSACLSSWGNLGKSIARVCSFEGDNENPNEKLVSPSVPLDRMVEEPIAVVGMACRLPASNDVEEFWTLLMEKGDAVQKVPMERWREEQVKTVTEEHRDISAAFLKCPIDEFDGKFFGMSPKELEFTDPQQRLLMEVSWEALEDAAIDPTSLKGTQTGIFTGTWTHHYEDIMNQVAFGDNEFFRSYIGNAIGAAAGRMAFFYGTTGSNIATESGCSSSMVAVGLACKSLRRRETSMALACGVNLILKPFNKKTFEAFCADDGHCKTFDAAADGFGRAEGCGVLVLKRLSDAVRDGDKIHAVIRGYGEAQEGPSRSLGTPTVEVEALAMSMALEDAEVLPWEVSAVEAHGTGTAVGDPLEMDAIRKVYSSGRKVPLFVTSVKTNVGHTESCSGITGIIKTVLSLQREIIPPHRGLQTLNPKIDLSLIPAAIPTDPVSWPVGYDGKRRIAGVSSFGITGTDAHVIIEESPTLLGSSVEASPVPFNILALSAQSEAALRELVEKYRKLGALKSESLVWNDLTFTVNTGRAHFDKFRAAIVATDLTDFLRQAKDIQPIEIPSASQRPKVVFLFTGYGGQYCGMAKVLHDTSPEFRRIFCKYDKILREKYSMDLKKMMWDPTDPNEPMSHPLYTTLLIFIVEVCVTELWESWGIKPDVIVGHSLGEFAAACVAGIMTVEETLRMVVTRGEMVQNLERGKMIAVKADLNQIYDILDKIGPISIDVAAINSLEQTTLAGTAESVMKLKEFCVNNGIKSHILEASHAFHSRMMDPALPGFRKVMSSIHYKKPRYTYVSGLEGRQKTSFDADYWVRHTREAVNFIKACDSITEDFEDCVYVEVGPTPLLSSFVSRNFERHSTSKSQPKFLPSLRKNQNDWRMMMETLGQLYTAGISVNWKEVHRHSGASKLSGLPTYPFQRKKFWFTKPKTEYARNGGLLFDGSRLHPLVHSRFPTPSDTKTFQSLISLEKDVDYVKDHVVGRHVVFPAAGYVEMILAAGHSASLADFEGFRFPRQPIFLRDMVVDTPMGLADEELVHLQTIVAPSSPDPNSENANWNSVSVYRQQEDSSRTKSWVRHVSAKYSSFSTTSLTGSEIPEAIDIQALKDSFTVEETIEFYESLRLVGLNFGEAFRSIRRIWRGSDGRTLSEVTVPAGNTPYLSHPVAIDAMIQALMASSHAKPDQLMVPVKIKDFVWFCQSPDELPLTYYVHVDLKTNAGILFDMNGRRLALMSGLTLVPTTTIAVENALESQKLVLPTLLEEEWLPLTGNSGISDSNFDWSSNELLSLFRSDTFPQPTASLDEQQELKMINEMAALQALQAFLDMGWTSTVDEIFDVRDIIAQLGILPRLTLSARRFFEIISQHTNILEGSGFFFKVTSKGLPSVENVIRRIQEIQTCVNHFKSEVECIRSVAGKTVGVLQGKDSVLPILFGDDKIGEKVYTTYASSCQRNDLLVSAIQRICSEVATTMGDKKPKLRILEVGGGTGGSTRSILPALTESGIDYSYTFTDVSAGFFVKAESAFARWKDHMEFQVLDIEKDPKTQGFIHNEFDIIIATLVLHATRDIKETMTNVRHLLRPNGIALIGEDFEPLPVLDLIFGLVDGYWRFEDFELRPYHCILPEDSWPSVLSSCGFERQTLLKIPTENTGIILTQATNSHAVYSTPSNLIVDTWLVLSGDDEGDCDVSSAMTAQLNCLGRRVVYLQDAESDADWKSKLSSGRVETVVVIATHRTFDATQSAQKFLRLLQSLLSTKFTTAIPKLAVITKGTIVLGDQSYANPHAATLWGMSKSFRSENPTFSVVNIDFDPHETQEVNVEKACKIVWTTKKDFLALRDNVFFAPKLKKLKLKSTALHLLQNSQRSALIFPKTNAISDLRFGPMQTREVSGNSVEIEVRSAALNFKDLLSVLKPIKAFEKNAAVGADMAGIVTAVGPDASNLKVGDAVFGAFFEFGGLPSHIVVPEDLVVPIPDHLTFADAATLPAVFTTAYHCLVDLAKLKKGEIVLIHTATGGVGLVAIQIAKEIGARIIATAGSKRKRAYLKEVIGIEHIFHSRDLTYAQEIARVTGGRGVDVVLNSLTGVGFKEATLDVCGKNGRFVEMSKLNIWSESDVRQLRPDVDYHLVDLTAVSTETWKHLLTQMDNFLSQRKLKPLPYESFESVEIRGALTHLQKARHIGKIVCKMPQVVKNSAGNDERRQLLFNERSSYLITGGLGGIGLEAAKWMANEGAKFIILCGRSLPSQKAANVISELNATGKVVVSVQADVGKWEDCKYLIDLINGGKLLSSDGKSFPPLRGIQHAAGCLSDGTFPNQTWNKYTTTFNAKVTGAWNLHKLTLETNDQLPLEHFVMYSSVAGTLGTMGQSNHAAGNTFLDALTHFRNALGLPATSVNWGQWGQVGVAADLEVSFCTPFTPLQAFASLKEILKSHKPQVGVIEADFSKLRLMFPWMDKGGYGKDLFDTLSSKVSSTSFDASSSSTSGLKPSEKFWEEVKSTDGQSPEAQGLVQRLLLKIISQILKMDENDNVDLHQNLQDLGLDSLMMVELKNLLQGVLAPKVTLTSSIVSDAKSIDDLATTLRKLIWTNDNKDISEVEKAQRILTLAKLPESISPPKNLLDSADLNGKGDITVLLKGSVDSQLAACLLQNLTHRQNVKKVVVLALTEQKDNLLSQLQAEELQVINKSKLELIVTDPTLETNLGLSQAQHEKLSIEVDAIVDCRMSFNNDESISRVEKEANDSKMTLEFSCKSKLKSICLINRLLPAVPVPANASGLPSSVSVADEVPCDHSENDLKRYSELGYSASQFASECLLSQASQRGIPCSIFRLPHLSGDTRSGRFDLEEGHIYIRYLEFLQIEMMPDIPLPFAVIPVDQAASLVLQVALDKSGSAANESMSVFNLTNPHEYSSSGFSKVSKELGKPVTTVDLQQFMADTRTNSSHLQKLAQVIGDPFEFLLDNSTEVKVPTNIRRIPSKNIRKFMDSFPQEVDIPYNILRRDLAFAFSSGLAQKYSQSK